MDAHFWAYQRSSLRISASHRRGRPLVRGAAILMPDSDASPRGCLILGSTASDACLPQSRSQFGEIHLGATRAGIIDASSNASGIAATRRVFSFWLQCAWRLSILYPSYLVGECNLSGSLLRNGFDCTRRGGVIGGPWREIRQVRLLGEHHHCHCRPRLSCCCVTTSVCVLTCCRIGC